MGTTISKFAGSIGPNPPDQFGSLGFDNVDGDDAEENPRPSKRRRLNVESIEDRSNKNQDPDNSSARLPLGQLTSDNERSRTAKPGMVQPSDFYGKSKFKLGTTLSVLSRKKRASMNDTKTHLDGLVPSSPVDFTKSLRVDVEGISLKSSTEFQSETIENDADIPCKVAVALFYCQDEDREPGTFTQICKMVKSAIMQISVEEDGEVVRKLVKSEPFFFLPEHFFVHRKIRKPNGQFGGYESTYDFADRHRIIVTIESTTAHIEWPALHIPEGDVTESISEGRYDTSDFQLMAKHSLFGSVDRLSKIPLFVTHVHPGKLLQQSIPYTLAIQTQWAAPNTLKNAVLEAPKALPAPTTITSPIPVPATAPISDDMVIDPPDISNVDSTLASSRARRDRNTVEYNLKKLSTKAQGKSPRKQRSKEPVVEASGEITVTYSLHQGHAQDIGLKQRTVQVSGLDCQFCSAKNRSVEELRLHLHNDHGHFKFSYRHGPPRVQFFIEIAKPRSGPMLDIERAKTFQLTQPKTVFDLGKYLSTEAWTKARHGPQHSLWPSHLQEKGYGSSSSSSPGDSRYSSPNTSNNAEGDDADEFEENKPPQRPRKVHLIPHTAKPLYHPITKQRLIPGDELPDSDEERDESWLHQKHRDLVNDFTDVSAEEKDYINGWNRFIVPKKLTSTKFMALHVKKFVTIHTDWFCEVETRKKQFFLHMKVFILRGVFSHNVLWNAIDILREAENAKKKQKEQEDTVMKDAEPEKPVPKSRPYLSCICGKHTNPALRVRCSGETCENRFFCEDCATGYGRPLGKEWPCPGCFFS